MVYDLAIIGGGPAGIAAGVYAARKHLKTIFISEEIGGQSIVSTQIQNWIGDVEISGEELARKLEAHLRAYAGEYVTIEKGRVEHIIKNGDAFQITDTSGTSYETHAVLIATGAHRRRLEVPGADKYEHKGLTYCASCDGPLFGGMDVAVIGGGNAGFETAAQLLEHAKSVTLIHRHDEFKADPITVEKVLAHPNMTALKNAEPTAVRGEAMVTGLMYKDLKTGEEKDLPLQGIFVEIGLIPTTGLAAEVVDLDEYKRIIIDPWTQQTSCKGVWAAGDCTNAIYHQNNIAAGDAVRALEDIYVHLRAK